MIKTIFTVLFGHYEWNVMTFELKNAPFEFQNIMNDFLTEEASIAGSHAQSISRVTSNTQVISSLQKTFS